MIKPVRPKRPRKPRLLSTDRDVVECKYIYQVRTYSTVSSRFVEKYILIDEDAVHPNTSEVEDGFSEPVYEGAFDLKVSDLVKLVNDNNIDPKKAVIIKDDWYTVLRVSKTLSDEEYSAIVTKNSEATDEYDQLKSSYPDRLASYKEQKRLWDIERAEQKLRTLRT